MCDLCVIGLSNNSASPHYNPYYPSTVPRDLSPAAEGGGVTNLNILSPTSGAKSRSGRTSLSNSVNLAPAHRDDNPLFYETDNVIAAAQVILSRGAGGEHCLGVRGMCTL